MRFSGATAEDVARAHVADVQDAGEVRRRVPQILVQREPRQDFLPVQRAERRKSPPGYIVKRTGWSHPRSSRSRPRSPTDSSAACEVNPAGAALVPGGAATDRDPGIRTVMFTDIVDSTALTQRLGDDAAMAFLRVHDTIVREALGALGGREVKHTGDGIMACFVSTVAAVRCACPDSARAG